MIAPTRPPAVALRPSARIDLGPMSSLASLTTRLPVDAFAEQFRNEVVPVNNSYSYFAATPLDDTQLQQFAREPIAALPPSLTELLPPVRLLLVPYLERSSNKDGDQVSFEKPAENRKMAAASVERGGAMHFFLAVKDVEAADYHYTFFNGLASMLSYRLKEEIGRASCRERV